MNIKFVLFILQNFNQVRLALKQGWTGGLDISYN